MWAAIHLRKIFIGGLDYMTTDKCLKDHFSKYGDVVDAVVMKDQMTTRSRGFGFVTFQSPADVDAVQNARPHKIGGRLVETKRAVPRTETPAAATQFPTANIHGSDSSATRIFIGGLSQEAKESDLEHYFEQFGKVTCVNIMYDKASGRHRGFAFVDFNDYDPVDKVLLTRHHSIKGRQIDVKKAIGKSDINKLKAMAEKDQELQHVLLQNLFSGPGIPSTGFGSRNPAGPNIINLHNLNGAPIHQAANTNIPSAFHHPPNAASSHPHPPASQGVFGAPSSSSVPPQPSPGGMNAPKPAPFSAQPHSAFKGGWKYTVCNNAEVLRNTMPATATPSAHHSTPEPPTASNVNGDLFEDEEMKESKTYNADSGPSLDSCPPNAHVLVIEPFCSGSHKQLITTFLDDSKLFNSEDVAVFTMPGKKWHWRARTAALTFSQRIPSAHLYKVLFCSATLNLCELIGLRPDLAHLHKVMYFHENQLVYPVRQNKERDFQYGYNQITSCLVADSVIFNSQYNLESFLREVPRHLNLQKDGRADTAAIASSIRAKSKVLYFPVNSKQSTRPPKDASEPLHIIWPHRWEHDKDPDSFFSVLFQLAEAGHNFRVSVLGCNFSETPAIFAEARQRLHNFIVHWGYAQTKDKYWEILHAGDVVVSTAHHEFFGVAVLEAVGAGCFPLCPNRLVYPEIYPQECLYNTQNQLFKALANWCVRPNILRKMNAGVDLSAYSWTTLRSQYAEVLGIPDH